MTLTQQPYHPAQASPNSTDPKVYEQHKGSFTELPTDVAGWIKRAQDVGEILAADAAKRDRENKSPLAEVALLKHSGLLRVVAPTKYNGGGQPVSVGYRVFRELAKYDGSIGAVLGYHTFWTINARTRVLGTEEEADAFEKLVSENNYLVGSAVNPRDNDLQITVGDDGLTWNGSKHFTTNAALSDIVILEGALDTDATKHIFAYAPSKTAGISFGFDWDNLGLRLTESGSAKFDNVKVPWANTFGWKDGQPIPEATATPYASLLLPNIQLVFSNIYLGLAQGALEAGKQYTTKTTRAWPYGGEKKEKGTDEFYILSTYGNFYAHVRAAEALADKVNDEADKLYAKYSADRTALTPRARGEFAEEVASLKVVTTDTGLRVTAGIYEVVGARGTSNKTGLDRFWRDIRTHSLHDPVAYKNREQGVWFLLDQVPEPSWYT
ncbi:hypothetical protein Q8F55_004715 [Vanrija albida]|uniref:Acyl-CoA dehydrogenase C-terminal domain-containing protein n=1 Tax=Vanrija albida TaxID=181172 RepID=A0ABR3PZN6_9TREE